MTEVDPAIQQRIEELLLGGARRYTRLEVADRSGVPLERATQLWHSLGFAAVPDDAVVFTDGDLVALRIANELIQAGITDPTQAGQLARVMGQHLGRLAESQVETLREILVANPELAADERQLTRFIERIVPDLERLLTFSWRRHLAAYAGRALLALGEEGVERQEVIGFADMVGFTSFTRRSSEAELVSVVDRFDAITAEVVAEAHGRIVKMIGDEVLFVADTPARGAEIALTLLERAEREEPLPLLRAGLAYGRVLSRFGDVYGSTVNLASRLASIARPGTVLTDRNLAEALADDPAYTVRHRRPIAVRGYARLRASVLRRAEAATQPEPEADFDLVPHLPLEPDR